MPKNVSIKDLDISYLHVFSYSERENTKAILLDNKVDQQKRAERSKMLRILSSKLQRLFYKRFENTHHKVLFEQDNKDGFIYGFTENYIKIKIPFDNNLVKNSTNVLLNKIDKNLIMKAQINQLCIQQ